MKKVWIPLAVVAVLVGAYLVADVAFRGQARRAEAAYLADGHTLDTVSLARMFESGSSAAADTWLAAAALMTEQDGELAAHLDTLGWRVQTAEVRQFVADKARVIELAAHAVALGPADYGMDPLEGLDARIAETPRRIGSIRNTLLLAARLLAEDGRTDSALALLTVCMGTVDAFGEPILLYHAVNILALDTTLSRVAAVAPQAGSPAVARAAAELEAWDLKAALVRAFEAEAAMMRVRAPHRTLPPVRNFALAHFLGFARTQLEAFGLAWHEAAPVLESLGRELPRTLPGRLGMALPNAGLFHAKTRRLEARRLATLAGLRTLLAGRPGRWAPDAGGLLDPYTGKELLCRELADGFVIYSVGPDGEDDGGDGLTDISFRAMRQPNDRGAGR